MSTSLFHSTVFSFCICLSVFISLCLSVSLSLFVFLTYLFVLVLLQRSDGEICRVFADVSKLQRYAVFGNCYITVFLLSLLSYYITLILCLAQLVTPGALKLQDWTLVDGGVSLKRQKDC